MQKQCRLRYKAIYLVKEILEQENIFVMDDTRAMHQDIRPIQILILKSDAIKGRYGTSAVRSLGPIHRCRLM